MQWFSTADLLKALRDSDPNVCCRAAYQARTQRLREAVPALVELLYRSGPASKRVIIGAARALGDIGDLRAIQHLEEAGFAHEYSGAITGHLMYTADGEVIEPAEEDVLMDEALREAEGKLWKQPGAEPYLAQLGRIKMYTFGDFLRGRGEILIHPDIQKQREDPFTMECASRFFADFKKERFAFESEIKSIFIRGGKARQGQPSYADGAFYPQALDELEEIERRVGKAAFDHPIGCVHLESGGNAKTPFIEVSPEPKWPRPSIVRRCVLDGRTGIRFDEIS